jgi:hypothetical protein
MCMGSRLFTSHDSPGTLAVDALKIGLVLKDAVTEEDSQHQAEQGDAREAEQEDGCSCPDGAASVSLQHSLAK